MQRARSLALRKTRAISAGAVSASVEKMRFDDTPPAQAGLARTKITERLEAVFRDFELALSEARREEPQDRTKVAKVSEHRRRPPIHSSRTKPVRRVNGPAASKQRLARVRRTAPEWIATILVDKDHVTCRRGIFW